MFIPFIMAGDPSPDITVELALALQEAGASILELGIPYSDPLADGPIIQRSAARALNNGVSLKNAIELVPAMRKKGLKIPVIVFTYFNPVLQLGEDYFLALAKKNDIDGLLIPDLPFEESESLRNKCLENGLEFISLVAPTSKQRIIKIASQAQGFLYCVSSLGVTGVRQYLDEDIYTFLQNVKQYSNVPIAVGFGISTPDQVQMLKEHSDGIVMGSALIQKVEELSNQLLNSETFDLAIDEFKQFIMSVISPINR